jgi:ribosomal protein S18 acetylase RimI-like enzyme
MTMTAETIEFTLREELTARDRGRIFNLLNTGGFFTTREMAYAMNLLDRSFREGETGDYRFILLEDGNTLLGYGCYGLLPLCHGRYHIYWIAIDRTRRNQGLGKRIETAITASVRKLGGAKIYAEISNRGEDDPTQLFYAHCGYKLAATIPNYYADGDSMMLFEKDLGVKL